MKIKKILFGVVALTVVFNPYYVFAEEITVSGNGDSSSNNVNIQSSNNSEVSQNNNATVNNNVTVNANTGNNNANENTNGTTEINTGDINTQVQIVNAGINQSYAQVNNCCETSSNIKVSGNGSDSSNTVGYSSNNLTNVNVNNNANIYNSINGTANTGYNTANENNGNVVINTGSITVEDVIKNKSINISEVKAGAGNGGSVYVAVEGNGEGSINEVKLANNSSVNIAVNNNANIVNESTWKLNTGNNEANDNNGDVAIATGDIIYKTTIENTDINVSIVDVDCCKEDHGNPPDDNPPPYNPPSGGPCTSNCGGGSNNPANGTASNGPVLPVTGGDYSLMFFALIAGIMFFMGWYLRLHSGRSPNLAR